MSETASKAGSGEGEGSRRIVAVDALRGFDMIWIIGADLVVQTFPKISDNPITRFLAGQVDHSDWAGVTFYDLIFPLFIFIVGISVALSLSRTIAREGRATALKRVVRRAATLYLLGFVFYGGFSALWPGIRLLGVLPRIAICYLFAGVLFCFFRARILAAICGVILLGYWAAMALIPFPDVRPVPGGDLTICRETGFDDSSKLNLRSTRMLRDTYIKGVNLANYIDQRYLPGYKWDGSWDPEGLVSTPAAVVTCLLGVLAGLLLKDPNRSDRRKVAILLATGAGALAAGWIWGLWFPVIKKIWTSSYVLVAAGYASWMTALFYYVVEIRQVRRWTLPFVWIGMNPITVYVLCELMDFPKLAERLAGGDVRIALDRIAPGTGDLLLALVGLSFGILLCRFLYQRKIFLKI
jgi:predicted acyltransferase